MTKKEIRDLCKKKRGSVSRDGLLCASESAVTAIKLLPEYKAAKTVLLYNAVGGEIVLDLLIADARDNGKITAFPVCDVKSETMTFVTDVEKKFTSGAYGIPEPVFGDAVTDFSASVCIIPALAFDEKGNRLGRGKGYYDKFLSGYSGTKIGVSQDGFVLEEIPTDENDVPVDLIVTEKRVIRLK